MRRFFSQLHKSVPPFGSCRGKRFSSPSTSLSSSHRSSAVAGKRPLLWQDYFPHSFEQGGSDMTQMTITKPLSNAERQVIKESLEIDHGCLILDGTQINMTKRSQVFIPEFPHAYRPNSALEASEDVCTAQLSGEEKRMGLANILNALDMLDEVNEPLSANDYICILQKCKKQQDLVLAKRVQTHIRGSGLEAHIAVGNHLVPVFVECGSVADAQAAFDRLPLRNVYSWTALLVGYIQHGQLLHALNLYEKMQAEGIPPSSYTLVALVKVCTSLRDMEKGRKIYTQAVQCGVESEVIVGSTLIDMYTKSHSMAEAQKVFDKLLIRNVVAWSALIAGYAELGEGQAALDCFERMQVEGVIPNSITYISVLKACCNAGLIEKGQNIHTEIVHKGFERDLFFGKHFD